MKKVVGYIIAVIGLIVILLSFEPIKQIMNIPTLTLFSKTQMMIAGLVLTSIGVILVGVSKNNKQHKEVPIYKGDKVVGYRRH